MPRWLIADRSLQAADDQSTATDSKQTWITRTFGLARKYSITSDLEHKAFYAALPIKHDLNKAPNYTKLAMKLKFEVSASSFGDGRRYHLPHHVSSKWKTILARVTKKKRIQSRLREEAHSHPADTIFERTRQFCFRPGSHQLPHDEPCRAILGASHGVRSSTRSTRCKRRHLGGSRRFPHKYD